MQFKKEDLQELVWSDPGGGFNGMEVVENNYVESSRWSEHRELIFKHEEKFYAVGYSRGLTECQEEGPFEYAGDMIKCKEVEPVEKVILIYKPVKKSGE